MCPYLVHQLCTPQSYRILALRRRAAPPFCCPWARQRRRRRRIRCRRALSSDGEAAG